MEEATISISSQEKGLLYTALGKAQASYKPLIANQDSPGGKYANLQAVLAAVRDALAANDLGFFQCIELLDEGSGAALLKTTIGHKSNQYIESCTRIIPGNTERETGNLIEIYKRRHACMLLGIAPTEHDPECYDDNSEQLTTTKLIEKLRKPKEPQKEPISRSDVINKDQYQELLIELDGYESLVEDIFQCYGITTLADVPREEYHKAMAKIRKIKRTQEEYRNKNA